MLITYFNPRAYVRHDAIVQIVHALDQFQSTCLREARPYGGVSVRLVRNFNPRAYVRHDQVLREAGCSRVFQSTCLREARPIPYLKCRGNPNFNPRAYVRHDPFFIVGFSTISISIHVPT